MWILCAACEVEVEYVLSWIEYFFCGLGGVKFLLQLERAKKHTKKRLLKKALTEVKMIALLIN